MNYKAAFETTKKAVLAAVIACAILAGCGAVEVYAAKEENRARFVVLDSEWIDTNSYAKIVVDKETGVMYFMLDISRGGGITVMVDADGKPLIWEG